MKQLTCEMCGSTEMLKQNGVFVCQTCGTKYSVEEARKMMNEGAIEVQGTINVHNAAQLENLLNLARNSFDSKNYAQAEAFCNQIIAMNDKHYEAWKLKGESINFQISATNPRILEVYNCIMTSYRVLDSKQKEEKRHEILASLKTCFEGEVEFWLQQFEATRPTEASLLRVKNAYTDAYNKMSSAFDELGLSTEKESYLRNFDNDFIDKANRICVSAWRTTVGYNYYRDDLDVLGRNWGRGNAWSRLVTTNTNLYRPLRNQFDTFLDEGGNLIDLLQFAEQQFNTETPHQVKEDIFDNIIYFHRCLSDACWYEIGTSGYDVGWCFAGSLTNEAVDIRNNIISIYNGKKRLLKEEQEQEEEAKRQAERREFEKKLEKFKVECQSYEVNKLKEMAKDYFLKYQTDDGSACYDEYLEICSETIIKKEPNCVSAYLCMLSYDPYRKQLKKLVENGVMPTENDKKYVEFYLNYVGEDNEPIFSWLLDNGYYWIVEYLIDLGLDVNAKDSCGKTALFSVAAYTCPEAQISDVRNLAKKLLDAGADANITITDEKGTEISLLNRDTDPEIASMIVKKYPEIKQGRNSDGKMPKKYYVSIARNIAIAVAASVIFIVSCVLINKANTYSDAVDLWEQELYTDAAKVFYSIEGYSDTDKYIDQYEQMLLESLMTNSWYSGKSSYFSYQYSGLGRSDTLTFNANHTVTIDFYTKHSGGYKSGEEEIEELTFDYIVFYNAPYITIKLVRGSHGSYDYEYTVRFSNANNCEIEKLNGQVGGEGPYEDFSPIPNKFVEKENYSNAVSLMNNGEYEKAISILESLGDYENSKTLLNECKSLVSLSNINNANVGDTIVFGTYEQDNDKSNGKEDIEWLILEKQDAKVFVISKYALDCKKYDDSYRSDSTWERSFIRDWLNDDFYNEAFGATLQECVLNTYVTADKNPVYDTDPGFGTWDNIFLLSMQEVMDITLDLDCGATEYAQQQGAEVDNGFCWWWLRTPGKNQGYAAAMGGPADGYQVYSYNNAVRPAMWIDLRQIQD